jgi:transposase
VVHSASVQDSAGARILLPLLAERCPMVRTVFADGGYQGKLLDWATETLTIHLNIIKRTLPKGFQVLPKRWVVERTFAWLGWNRRLSKDYEVNPRSAECFLFLAAAMVLLRRT